jgi:hypothetical protein
MSKIKFKKLVKKMILQYGNIFSKLKIESIVLKVRYINKILYFKNINHRITITIMIKNRTFNNFNNNFHKRKGITIDNICDLCNFYVLICLIF